MPLSRAFQPAFDAWEQRVRESFARQAFMGTLGAPLAGVAPGAVDIEVPASAAMTSTLIALRGRPGLAG